MYFFWFHIYFNFKVIKIDGNVDGKRKLLAIGFEKYIACSVSCFALAEKWNFVEVNSLGK